MRRAFLVFACVAMLAAPPARAQAPPGNGMLAAVADSKLVTVNADGSGLRTLWAPASGEISGLAWSPDGNRLAMAYGGQIVVYDLAAGRVAAITTGRDPAWSADGRRIGLRRDLTRVVVGLDGSGGTPAALDPLTTAFAWAPNLVDFAAVVGPLLLAPEIQAPVSGVVGAPAWSLDGARLAFADAAGL